MRNEGFKFKVSCRAPALHLWTVQHHPALKDSCGHTEMEVHQEFLGAEENTVTLFT